MWLHTRCLLDWLPHRLAWVALLLGLSSGLALAVPQCELNGEPVSPSNGHTTAGKSGLMRCTDDSGPIRLREQTLRDGRFEGPARFVMQSGERREYNVNARGNREGVFREWDASGNLRSEQNLDNGQAIGEQKTFAASGHLARLDYVVNRRVGIPSIDVIEYHLGTQGFHPSWHTHDDSMEVIDRNTLEAVGRTVTAVVWQER